MTGPNVILTRDGFGDDARAGSSRMGLNESEKQLKDEKKMEEGD